MSRSLGLPPARKVVSGLQLFLLVFGFRNSPVSAWGSEVGGAGAVHSSVVDSWLHGRTEPSEVCVCLMLHVGTCAQVHVCLCLCLGQVPPHYSSVVCPSRPEPMG